MLCLYETISLDADKLKFCFRLSHAIDIKENRVNIVRFEFP